LRGNQTLTPWQQQARQKIALTTVQSQKTLTTRPEWNDRPPVTDEHKLSHAEQIQKKLNARSKNHDVAKQEVQAKLSALKQGKLPEEYKEIVYQKKTFTSKQSFI
jgi:hypothetical protein